MIRGISLLGLALQVVHVPTVRINLVWFSLQVVDMASVLEVVSQLEKAPITQEVLEVNTRAEGEVRPNVYESKGLRINRNF